MPKPTAIKGKRGLGGTGAGMPKGYKFPATEAKEAARELVRTMVIAKLEPLVSAQIENAIGLRHTFMRDPKTGQFTQLTDPEQIATALNSGEEGRYYWTFTKDPNPQSARELLDRALDRAKEQSIDVNFSELVPTLSQAALLAEAEGLVRSLREKTKGKT